MKDDCCCAVLPRHLIHAREDSMIRGTHQQYRTREDATHTRYVRTIKGKIPTPKKRKTLDTSTSIQQCTCVLLMVLFLIHTKKELLSFSGWGRVAPVITTSVLRGVPTLRTDSAHTHRPGAHGLLEVPLHLLPSPAKLFQRRIRVKIIEVAALDSSLARSPRSVGFPCGLPSRSSTQSCRRTPAKWCQ